MRSEKLLLFEDFLSAGGRGRTPRVGMIRNWSYPMIVTPACRLCLARRILRALPSAAGPSLPIADWDRDLAVLAGSGWLAAGCCWTAGICLGGLPVLQVLVQDARGKL